MLFHALDELGSLGEGNLPRGGRQLSSVHRGLPRAALLALLALNGCGGDDLQVILTVSPGQARAPAWVDIDASDSKDLRGGAITARFDFNGDGNFEASDALKTRFLYETAGTYSVAVEILADEGRSRIEHVALTIDPNLAPSAQLEADRYEGVAPLLVQLDASLSTDSVGSELEYRFDFQGDGTWDTGWTEAATTPALLQTPGAIVSKVQVRDAGGLTAEAALTVPIQVRAGADLDVDTDRDGDIDDDDEAQEEVWTRTRGALVLANLDDDDRDGRPDGSVRGVAGTEDSADLSGLLIRAHPGLTRADSVVLNITPAAALARIQVYSQGLRPLSADSGGIQLDPTDLSEDQFLWVEATEARSGSWDGTAQLTLRIATGSESFEDTVTLRTTPVVFTHHLNAAERLFVMQITDRRLVANDPFYDQLRAQLSGSGINLVTAEQYEWSGDRWLQDPLQSGYQEATAIGGSAVRMPTFLKTERPTEEFGLEFYVDQAILAPNVGFAYPGRSRDTSLNYGGNLEIAPPHTGPDGDFPLGRIVIGGGILGLLNGSPWQDHMSQRQTEWLDAQEVQGPSVEVSTEWLAVGHIDEIFLFLPNLNAAEGERPWKVAIASPDLAWRLLEEAAGAGAGAQAVFNGRETETTVNRILGDTTLQEINDAAQARIDTVREGLTQHLGLTEADFFELPVLFETIQFDTLELAAAYNPGIQNMVVAGDQLFVPDPEGPNVNGQDPWQAWAQTQLGNLGFEVQFVDVFDAYHLQLGEAHCGTLVQRTPPEASWWSVYEEAQP